MKQHVVAASTTISAVTIMVAIRAIFCVQSQQLLRADGAREQLVSFPTESNYQGVGESLSG